MPNDLRLKAEALRKRCNPADLGFESTAEVEPLEGMIGQPRALSAVGVGLEIESPGCNLFVTGLAGTGRRSMMEEHLKDRARRKDAPADWLYLSNFASPDKPLAVRLGPGRAGAFARAMDRLVREARERIPRAFESEAYGQRRAEIAADLEKRRDEAVAELREFARQRDLALELTPAGAVTIPVAGGKPLPPQQFRSLPAETRRRFEEHNEEVKARLPGLMKRLREIEREGAAQVTDLDREVAMFAIGHLVDDVKEEFPGSEAIGDWLDRVREDMIENISRFRRAEGGEESGIPDILAAGLRDAREDFFRRYRPNVLVENEAGGGAPVVVETNPTYYNLFGRIEYESAFGAVRTDHLHVKAGSLHRANGGYLVLQALDALAQPFVWSKLKEALRTRQLRIESIGTQLMLFPSTTLEPESLELDVKVVMIGPPALYTLLHQLDEDFAKLFKIRVDFDVSMPRGDDEVRQYARFIARRVAEDGLPHFGKDAVARLVEHGSRLAGHQEKLSLRLIRVADLVAEAGHWAEADGSELVRAEHVERAIAERVYRSNLVEEKVQELIEEGTLIITTAGERVGQVNGLSIVPLGDYEFGRPTRITATVAVGDGALVHVDRETEMSGPLHDKGFLILSGFLQERFGEHRPLSLHASTVFEQSYDEVEGDSASCAELVALLSALAEVPVRQGIAITGSVNQHGQVQAIGGVNEKVEGFFRVCRRLGLDGSQGVLIPAANVEHLMLDREVADAVAAGEFSIFAVRTADEALEVLTGVPAGERGPDGTFPEGTINRRAEDRLAAFADTARTFRAERGEHA